MMFQDFLELLRAFEKHKVRYVIIGGYAVGIYAEPRFTKDLDVLIEPSPLNAKRTLKALAEFGAPVDNLSISELATPGLLYVFGIPPLRVDLLNRIKRADVSGIVKRGKQIKIKNTTLRVVSLEDLITLKRIAGRDQDKVDLKQLIHLQKTAGKSAKPRSRK